MAIYDRVCRMCGMEFKGGPRAWYCPDCRKIREKERAAKYRKHGFERKIGDTDYCRHCGKPYIIKNGLQRYCPECGQENQKLVDRRQSLAYYKINKEVINPKRAEKRRVDDRICVVCGKLFHPMAQQKVCGEECRKIWIRQQQRKYDKKRREKKKKAGS